MTIGIAVIGAGKAGHILGRAFTSCADAEVVRIMSRTQASAQRLAEGLGVTGFGTELDVALRDRRVDAVVVASPDRFHCEQVVSAAQAGKHVLCEKPMCNTVEEAQRMISSASDAGVKLMIGFAERFNQPCVEAKERIESGEIGKPVMILARRCHPKFIVRGRDWLNDEETGGVLNYAGSHNIDLICWFMESEPERVYAETGKLVLPSKQNFTDSAVMTFRFRNGGIAALYESFGYPDPYPHGVDRSIEILGTEGQLEIDFMSQPLTVNSASGHALADSSTWSQIHGTLVGAVAHEVRHFLDCIIEDKPVLTPGEAGLRSLRLAVAANKAAATGEPQYVGEALGEGRR